MLTEPQRFPANVCALTLLLLVSVCGNSALAATGGPTRVIDIKSAPESPIIEVRDSNQFLNFDFIVRNVSSLMLRIAEIQLAIE